MVIFADRLVHEYLTYFPDHLLKLKSVEKGIINQENTLRKH